MIPNAFFRMLLNKSQKKTMCFLPPCWHMWTVQQETHHCMRIARLSSCLTHIQVYPWILTNIGTPYHHSWQKKGCNLMWGFPTRICPANIVLTSVVSVVLQHRISLYRLAGSVGASSKRLSWTTKFWSSQIFIACAPLDTTICLAPPHSISNPRCLVVLWVFAVPMSGSNQFYGTDVVSHFHQNLVSSVVPCALASPTTNSIQSGGQIRGQHRIKPIRLCTPMQLQNVQNRFV